MLTERGTFFGYHRLVNDFAGLYDMMQLGRPSASTSPTPPSNPARPDGKIHRRRRPDTIATLARCAAAGVRCLFIETHTDPKSAKSDAATVLPLETTLKLLGERLGCTKPYPGNPNSRQAIKPISPGRAAVWLGGVSTLSVTFVTQRL
ncbi:MAG: hypothetical protein R3C45_19400 [Phycisphaerales bacterium]